MNARRVLIVGLALVSVGACASRAPIPQTESILEVIDQAHSATPETQGKCPAGAVTYCELDSGRRKCSCTDAEEMRSWLRRSFGGT